MQQTSIEKIHDWYLKYRNVESYRKIIDKIIKKKNSYFFEILDFLLDNVISSQIFHSPRSLYYIFFSKFGINYSKTIRTINSICKEINIKRIELYIMAESNFLISSNFQIYKKPLLNKALIDNTLEYNEISSNISEFISDYEIIIDKKIKYLIIVEKKSIFTKIVSSIKKHNLNYHNHWLEEIIFCTGSGQPSFPTRIFLKEFKNRYPNLFFLSLVDGDPHGFLIHLTYKKYISTLNWIGIDSNDFNKSFLNNLKEKEINLAKKIIEKNDLCIKEINHLKKIINLSKKIELEVF